MTTMTVQLRSIPDTQASVGWAGAHTVVVDRPAGRAGGQGLGFNGGQLLALAIGGCLCNDLHYVAHAAGTALTSLTVEVSVTFEGDPLLATSAEARITLDAVDPQADVEAIIHKAITTSTVSNSIARGVPVTVMRT